jgi:hypothetical protein
MTSLMMGCVSPKVDPARYEQIAGRPIDERRIAILREEGAAEVTPEAGCA